MLSCKDVTRRIASDEMASAGLWGRLSVRAHLLMCRYCRAYAAQLREIGAAVRDLWGRDPEDPERIRRLERSILRAASSGRRKEPPCRRR